MASILEKNFLKYLDNPNIKTISFDIFETLAFRKVTKPKDIFLLVGQTEYVKNIYYNSKAFYEFRVNAEKNARKKFYHQDDITLNQIYEQLPLTNEQKKEIIRIELEIECENLYINHEVEDWILKANKLNKKIILVSDMYLSHDNIKNIIFQKLKRNIIIDKLYVSSSINKSKSKHTMFQYIQNDLSIEYGQWLHIGDNKKSDVINPKELGISTLHYQVDDYIFDMFKFEDEYLHNSTEEVHNMRVLSALGNIYTEDKDRFFYNIGSTVFAPILWHFSHWLKQVYDNKNLEQINFITREGITFQKYFDKLFPNIETNLIYASRVSTFLATFDFETFKKNGIDIYKFRNLTIRDLYSMLKLPITNKYILKYQNMQYQDTIDIYIKDEKLYNICSDDLKNRQDELEKIVINEKKIIKKYLQQLNISSNSMIVDLGGTGRSLESISDIININFKANILLYMHENGYKKMVVPNLISFFTTDDTKYIENIHRTPEFIEILLNGTKGTTLKYIDSNIVTPITDKHPDSNIESTIETFQCGIDNFFDKAKEYKLNYKNISNILGHTLVRIIKIPNVQEVQYLGSLIYDEGGGSGLVTTIINSNHINKIKQIGVNSVYYNFLQNIWYERQNILWIEGTITSIDNDFILKYYGKRSEDSNQNAIDSILKQLDTNNNITKINIYGAGELSKLLIPHILQKGIKIHSIIDSIPCKRQLDIFGYEVVTLEEAINKNTNYPIIIASIAYYEDIVKIIYDYQIKNNFDIKIIGYKL